MANSLEALNALLAALQQRRSGAQQTAPLSMPQTTNALFQYPNYLSARPVYGEEVPNPTPGQALSGLVSAIKQYQSQNPVYLPFPAGTPTLAREQFNEAKRQWEEEHKLAQKKLALSAAGGGTFKLRPEGVTVGNWMGWINKAKQQGKTYEDVKNQILSQADAITKDGYNVLDVLDALNVVYYGNKSGPSANNDVVSGVLGDMSGGVGNAEAEPVSNSAEQLSRRLLQQRPWWQKLVDALIPGGQFRAPQ